MVVEESVGVWECVCMSAYTSVCVSVLVTVMLIVATICTVVTSVDTLWCVCE